MITVYHPKPDLFYAAIESVGLFKVSYDADGFPTNNPGHAVRTETVKSDSRHVLAIGSTEKQARDRGESVLKGRMQ